MFHETTLRLENTQKTLNDAEIERDNVYSVNYDLLNEFRTMKSENEEIAAL